MRFRTIVYLPADNAGEFRGHVLDGTQIDILLGIGAITPEQATAAQRWYSDWYESGAGGHGASWRDWSGGPCVALLEQMTERQEECWRRYRNALEAMPYPSPREITSESVLRNVHCKNLVALRWGLSIIQKEYDRREFRI